MHFCLRLPLAFALVVAATRPARAADAVVAGDAAPAKTAIVAGDPPPIKPKSSPPAKPAVAPSGAHCLFSPRPECNEYGVVELALSGGGTYSRAGWQSGARFSTEIGILVASTTSFHWGPALDLGFDLGRLAVGWSLSPKLRGRLWLGRTVALEGSAGTVFERYKVLEIHATGNRIGLAGEFGISYHGVWAAVGNVAVAANTAGIGGPELRLLLGFRGNLEGWKGALTGPLGSRSDDD